MKTLYIFLLVSSIAFCQKTKKPKPDQARFDELIELTYEKKNQEALDGFRQFMVDFPDSELKPRAHYNLACLLRKTHLIMESAKTFKEILDAGYNDYEAYGGIMEQYSLYSNRSAENLAEIYLYIGNYDLAEEYVIMFDKEYPYQHFCGNEMMENDIYKARMYGEVYLGQGKTDKAIEAMLPYFFYSGIASNDELLVVLAKALEKKYSVDELKIMTRVALQSFQADEFGFVHIDFLGRKLEITWETTIPIERAHATEKLDMKQLLELAVKEHPIFSKYL